MKRILETDVLIIGGGITGAAVARELSKYKTDVTLVEKSPNLCSATSKGSHAMIYWGAAMATSLVLKSIMLPPGTPVYDPESPFLKAAREGFQAFEELGHNLDIPHSHPNVVAFARNDKEVGFLETLMEVSNDMCEKMGGGKAKMVDKRTLKELEPNLTDEAVAGLYDEDNLIELFGPDYAFALIDNAKDNGARVLMSTEVQRISRKNGVQIVETNQGTIEAEFVVNAGGRYADIVADRAGARDDWGLQFNRTQMMILDKRLKGTINNMIIGPTAPGVFDFLLPLHTGNIYVGCGTYDPVEDRDDTATLRENSDYSLAHACGLVPALSEKDVITSFYGVRYWATPEAEAHIIEASKSVPKFINAVIKMPGFTPAPAIGKIVVNTLAEEGLNLEKKENFNTIRKGIPRFSMLSNVERKQLIAQDWRYGNLVCWCEEVTEGEIVEAIRRGATTIQAVKFRTRAGMGRCQRNFCGPRITDILARELNVPINEIVQDAAGSREVLYKSK